MFRHEVAASRQDPERFFAGFGIKPADFNDQLVLDVGSTFDQHMFHALSQTSTARVISIDPNLPHTEEYKLYSASASLCSLEAISGYGAGILQAGFALEEFNWPDAAAGPALAARGQELPFRKSCVDAMFVFSSVVISCESLDEVVMFLGECNKALKPGGRAYIAPLIYFERCGSESYYGIDFDIQSVRNALPGIRRRGPVLRASLSGFGLKQVTMNLYDDGSKQKGLILTQKS